MHGDETRHLAKRKRNMCSMQAGGREVSSARLPVLWCPVQFDHDNEWLVVCTQSCSVVSRFLDGDPAY